LSNPAEQAASHFPDGTPAVGGRSCARSQLDGDRLLRSWLARCRELAESSPDGIEAPAEKLAGLARGDRVTMERARRIILAELDRRPGDATLGQMRWFWRRAFEKGSRSWSDVAPVGDPTAAEVPRRGSDESPVVPR